MAVAAEDIRVFIVLHNNHFETCMPFAKFGGHCFLYDFNTAKSKIAEKLDSSAATSDILVHRFSLNLFVSTILDELNANGRRRFVILFPSSTNYEFGQTQLTMFRQLQQLIPQIIDVFPVGHCMYACRSCGLAEHNLPFYYTRYFRKELGIQPSDILAAYHLPPSLKFSLKQTSTSNPRYLIAIAPSTGPLSLMKNEYIVSKLISLAQKLGNRASFILKLHPFFHLNDESESSGITGGHLLNAVAPEERLFAERLRNAIPTIDFYQHGTCALPLLELADMVITDLDSSVCFEALYFPPTVILCYEDCTHRYDGLDAEFLDQLNRFSTPQQLNTLIESALGAQQKAQSSSPPPSALVEVKCANEKGMDFFRLKYGAVDGTEVDRAAKKRRWFTSQASSAKTPLSAASVIASILATVKGSKGYVTDMERLALSVDIGGVEPTLEEDREFATFARGHHGQLQLIDFPAKLTRALFQKLKGQVMDAGSVFTLAPYNASTSTDNEENTESDTQPEASEEKAEDAAQNDGDDADEGPNEDDYNDFRPLALVCIAEPSLPSSLDLSSNIDEEAMRCVYLIDHCWTVDVAHSTEMLKQNEPLRTRLKGMMLPESWNPSSSSLGADLTDEEVTVLKERFWQYAQTYSVHRTSGDALEPMVGQGSGGEVWYLNDEVGSAIHHSPEPNVRIAPFLYTPPGASASQSMPMSLMWTVKPLEYGTVVTRDCCPGQLQKRLAVIEKQLFKAQDSTASKIDRLPMAAYCSDLDSMTSKWKELSRPFLDARMKQETPSSSVTPKPKTVGGEIHPPSHSPLRVWTDVALVARALTSPCFKTTLGVTDAQSCSSTSIIPPCAVDYDIIWSCEDMRSFMRAYFEASPVMTNQFYNDDEMCMKHRLSATMRAVHGDATDKFLPKTFDLVTELPQFVAEFLSRKERSEENTWIAKPWNLGRNEGIVISDDARVFLRLAESSVPRIVSKYIHNPLFFEDKKFDLRFLVLVRSLVPLEAFVYRMFWIRFGNRPFVLRNFDDPDTHFTVHNYRAGATLREMRHDEFIRRLEAQYSDRKLSWYNDIQPKIYATFRDILTAFAAACAPPPTTSTFLSSKHMQSTAMYGIDMMLTNDLQPQLCEVNFNPDCDRGVRYDPDLFNNVFHILFMDKNSLAHVNALQSVDRL